MKHSLISCFVSNPDKRKNIENVVATTGPAPANAVGNAVGNAVKYTHNAVYAARPQTGPMPGKNHPGAKSNQLPELVFAGNQLDSVSHPHAKVVLAEQQRPARKSSQFTLCDSSCSSTTLNQNDLCLHPKNLES